MRLICSLIGSTVTRKKINMICNDSCSKPVVDSGTLPTGSRVEKEIEEGSVGEHREGIWMANRKTDSGLSTTI